MQSNVFAQHRMPSSANYKTTAELDGAGNPVLSFRSPDGLYRLHLDGARQLLKSMALVGEHNNAAEISQVIDDAERLRHPLAGHGPRIINSLI
jgi:hypothetical protein